MRNYPLSETRPLLATARELHARLCELEQQTQAERTNLQAQAREAMRKGFEEGYAAGRAQGIAALSAIEPFSRRLLRHAHRLLGEMVMALCREVLKCDSNQQLAAETEAKVELLLSAYDEPDSPSQALLAELLQRELGKNERTP